MTDQEFLAQYLDWVLEHDARVWTEAAEHIVNNVGWRPPAQDDDLNLVCDMAFNWVRDFGVGDEDASREVIDVVERLRPHPTYEEWLDA